MPRVSAHSTSAQGPFAHRVHCYDRRADNSASTPYPSRSTYPRPSAAAKWPGAACILPPADLAAPPLSYLRALLKKTTLHYCLEASNPNLGCLKSWPWAAKFDR